MKSKIRNISQSPQVLLTRIDFNPDIDKWTIIECGMNGLIRSQKFNSWTLGMD